MCCVTNVCCDKAFVLFVCAVRNDGGVSVVCFQRCPCFDLC